MQAVADNSVSISILEHLRDNRPTLLVALVESGRIKQHLADQAEAVNKQALLLAKEPHPMFKGRTLGAVEAEMEALQQILGMDEEEDPKPGIAKAADKMAEAVRRKLESGSW